MALKKNVKRIRAWQLGGSSETERRLVEQQKIRLLENGRYEIMSIEARNGGLGGEIADKGDFFKVDEFNGEVFPYPLKADWFNAHHRRISDSEYEQIAQPLPVWFADDPVSEEIAFLIRTGKLIVTDREPNYFLALIWGTTLSAPKDSVIVCYDVTRTSGGDIFSIDFNLVARSAFDRDYTLL